MGFFAGPVLQSDARWLSGPVNVWVTNATTLEIEFSGIDYDLSFPEFMEHTFGDGTSLAWSKPSGRLICTSCSPLRLWARSRRRSVS